MKETVFKAAFDPETSELSDIFSHDIARALWCQYRSHHIISGDGLDYLNETCREITHRNTPFTTVTAKTFLELFYQRLSDIESARDTGEEWIAETIPFLTGENTVRIEKVEAYD